MHGSLALGSSQLSSKGSKNDPNIINYLVFLHTKILTWYDQAEQWFKKY